MCNILYRKPRNQRLKKFKRSVVSYHKWHWSFVGTLCDNTRMISKEDRYSTYIYNCKRCFKPTKQHMIGGITFNFNFIVSGDFYNPYSTVRILNVFKRLFEAYWLLNIKDRGFLKPKKGKLTGRQKVRNWQRRFYLPAA